MNGEIKGSAILEENSMINMQGGIVADIEMSGSSKGQISAGAVSGELNVNDSATLVISGGYFNSPECNTYVQSECIVTESDNKDYLYMVVFYEIQ